MNIYVGNLSYSLDEQKLQEVFEAFGEVSSVKIIADKYTGRSKGFGFIEMPNDDEAQNAIRELNDQPVDNRNLKVNEARKREDNRGGFNRDRRY